MKFTLTIDSKKEESVILISNSANDFTAKIENLVMSYNGNDEIVVYGDDEILNVKFSSVECFTIMERKAFAVLENGKMYRINHKLCEIEQKLPNYFIRINKSTIANERRIKSYKTNFTGSIDAVFVSGFKEYVSRRCFATIRRRFEI